MREASVVRSHIVTKSRLPLLAMLMFSLNGCSNVLPQSKELTISPWNAYDEASASFAKIETGKTRYEDLKALGFDPDVTPNIKRITYIDILGRFLPNPSIRIEDIDPAVSKCIRAREACYGLLVAPGLIDKERFGNAFKDVFGFERKTRITGWRFDGLVIVQDDLVVYKLAGGNANINELEERKRPLGPFQELSINGSVEL